MSDGPCEKKEPVAEVQPEVNEGGNDAPNEVEEEAASLEEIQRYEEEARRLLAGQDENACTYAEGYKPRQALYSCRTCVPEGGAGVCFGCSIHCHDGHDLVELYTKRRFKCDCGNGAFKEKCKLFEEKSARNERNAYNGNFRNAYCSCGRPYPDPEGGEEAQAEMMQCVACEDWFHPKHAGFAEPLREDLGSQEFTCKGCSERLPFMAKVAMDAPDEETVTCSFEKAPEDAPIVAHLLKSGWREKLCACAKCEDLYDKLGADWVHDADDSLDRYNELAESKMAEEDEENEKELNKLIQGQDRDVMIDVMQEVNHMKRKMAEMLTRVGEGSQVVTKEDIHQLFEGLKRERQEKFNRRMEALVDGKGDERRENERFDGEH